MTNPQIGFNELAAAQEQPEVLVNAADRALSGMLAGSITINFASDANYTLQATDPPDADDEWAFGTIVMTDTSSPAVLSAARDVIYPDVDTLYTGPSRALFIFDNQTAQTLTIKRSGQTGVSVDAGESVLVRHDGDDIVAVAVSSAAVVSQPYDIAAFVSGSATADEVVTQFVAVRAFTLPSGLTGSKADSVTVATDDPEFSIQKNGVEIGTMTFDQVDGTATFAMASATSFAAGDVLTVVAPSSSPDSTLADFSFTLAGTRS